MFFNKNTNTMRVGGLFSGRRLSVTETVIQYRASDDFWEVERQLVASVMVEGHGFEQRLNLTKVNGEVIVTLVVPSHYVQAVRNWLQAHMAGR